MMMPDPEPEGSVWEGASRMGPWAMTLTTEGRASATASGTESDLSGRLSSGTAATEDNAQPISRPLPATPKLARWPHAIRCSPRRRRYGRIFGRKPERDPPRRRTGPALLAVAG